MKLVVLLLLVSVCWALRSIRTAGTTGTQLSPEEQLALIEQTLAEEPVAD
jgi:hypothetical protein